MNKAYWIRFMHLVTPHIVGKLAYSRSWEFEWRTWGGGRVNDRGVLDQATRLFDASGL